MVLRFRLGAITLLAVAAACGPAPAPEAAAPPAVDSAAVLAATSGFWDGWVKAAIAGEMAGLEALLTDDVAIDAKDMPPMKSKAEFSAVFGPLLKAMKVNSETITIESAMPVTNELLYQTGNYVETTTMDGKTNTAYGRFAAALRKGTDGTWRIGYIMAFPDSLVPAKP